MPPAKYDWNVQMKENDMGGDCGMWNVWGVREVDAGW